MRSLVLQPLLQMLLRDLGAHASRGAVVCAQNLKAFGRIFADWIEPGADDIVVPIGDIRLADPKLALALYGGSFALAGHVISIGSGHLFAKSDHPRVWQIELHAFDWMHHLAVAGTPLAGLHAEAMVCDWLSLDERGAIPAVAWEADVAARRLRNWLGLAPILLANARDPFRHQLLASITRHVRHLIARHRRGLSGLPDLRIAAVLLAASITVPAFARHRAKAMRRLDDELARQILTDGGHVSRNPSAIVDALVEILPLRDALAHAGMPASQAMMNSIDRMLPMLRFFVGPTGLLAHFNGAAPVSGRLIADVLAADDAGGQAHGNASHSCYQRMEASGTVVIMDCGTPPPSGYRSEAHAGTLSFEFSSPTNRFITNCGTTKSASPEWRSAARETAAHSTLVVAGKPSAAPIGTGIISQLVGQTLVCGPTEVRLDRREHTGTTAIVASHDGYAITHNLIHERTLRFSAWGDRIDGRDLLMPSLDAPTTGTEYAVRFHLDPAIEPVLLTNGVVMLIAPDGEAWKFHAEDTMPTLEESVYLADPSGPVPTRQIVLTAAFPEAVEQRWMFVRTRGAAQGATAPRD